jgi:hypothetical protein
VNDAFDPKACATNQWKVWLKDGTRLYGRAFSGWGLLMLWVYVGLGVADSYNELLGMVAMACSGVLQLAHLTVIEQMRTGHVGVGATGRALKTLWQDNRALLGRTILTRGKWVFGLVAVLWTMSHGLAWLVQALSHPSSSAPVLPTTPVDSWWMQLWIDCGRVFHVAFVPLFFQFGGSVSFVLPLMKDGLDAFSACHLDGLATRRNLNSWHVLRMLILIVVLVSASMVPVLLPLLMVWWMAVTQCMYADVFERGSKIEALAQAPRTVATPTLVPVPAMG